MSLRLKKYSLLPLIAMGVGLSGCDNLEDDGPGNSAGTVASFSPSVGVTPQPTVLFFSVSAAAATNDPSLADSTLNIPSSSPPAVAANKLDGYSTGAPITIPMSVPIDPASVQAGVNVHLMHICFDALSRQPIGLGNDGLLPATDFEASVSNTNNTVILIKPTKVLRSMNPVGQSDCNPGASTPASASNVPSNGYMAIVTTGITSTNGTTFEAAPFYAAVKLGNPQLHDGSTRTAHAISLGLSEAIAAFLEPIRQLTSGLEGLANQGSGGAINPADIIMTTAFPTQSVGITLADRKANTASKGAGISNTGLTPANVGAVGNGNIYAGAMTVDYYLTAAANAQDNAPNTTHWNAAPLASGPGTGSTNLTFRNPTPVVTSQQTIPVLAVLPSGMTGPMPVAIFQHGITRSRADVLAIAGALNAKGIAVIAIDLPLHGEAPGSSLAVPGTTERTFNLDLNGDGNADPSGSYFINLSSLPTSRDNIRQGVTDLMQLDAELDAGIAELDSSGTPIGLALQATTTYFVGHSLGGITGTTFLGAMGPGEITAATLAMPGASIPKLLDGSASFAPSITAGLAAAGINSGTESYETFLSFAQQAIDAADPINYIANAQANTQIHLIEVVGDGANNLPDQTVPNNVVEGTLATGHVVHESAPLAGTDPLAEVLGFAQGVSDTATRQLAPGEAAVTRFTAGDHGSILNPAADAATTGEMQNQTAEFLSRDGACIVIAGDTSGC